MINFWFEFSKSWQVHIFVLDVSGEQKVAGRRLRRRATDPARKTIGGFVNPNGYMSISRAFERPRGTTLPEKQKIVSQFRNELIS